MTNALAGQTSQIQAIVNSQTPSSNTLATSGISSNAISAASGALLKNQALTSFLGTALAPAQVNTAQLLGGIVSVAKFILPWSWCRVGDGSPCDVSMLSNPSYKQVVIFPSGYQSGELAQFSRDSDLYVAQMSLASNPNSYSYIYRSQILYFSYWIPGGALGSPSANFGAQIVDHITRGHIFKMNNSDVVKTIYDIRTRELSSLNPSAVMVILNSTDQTPTANAMMASFLGTNYGIAKLGNSQMLWNAYPSGYIAQHETAHAMFGFFDEYFESSLGEVSLQGMDPFATPLLLLFGGASNGFGGFWATIQNALGVYEIKFSESLAGNGGENVDVTTHPSRVISDGYTGLNFDDEGACYFGRGTYTEMTDNLMKGQAGYTSHGGNLAFSHSASQRLLIDAFFGATPRLGKPNDRIRTAGPVGAWSLQWGSTARLLMFDADKNSSTHPTVFYDVEIGWWEGGNWRTAQTRVTAARRTFDLNFAGPLADTVKRVACAFGAGQISVSQGNSIDLCSINASQAVMNVLPVMTLPVPYQEVEVQVPAVFTRYFWRFRTFNNSMYSGWTGWSAWDRAL